MLLAIDTATRYASVALYDASGIISEATWRSGGNHSVETLPAIARMFTPPGLSPARLKGVAVAQGPGSFTGLRIGLGIAKGLCLGLGIPIIAVPTLDIISYAVGDRGSKVLAVLEAGRGRLCVAAYRFENGLPIQQGKIELVKTAEWVISDREPVLVAGEVSIELAERLRRQDGASNIIFSSPADSVRRAGYLAELAWDRLQQGKVDDLDSLSPIYVHYPSSGTPNEA